MNGRRILLTGVGRGLGHELARQLIESGNQVWGSVRSGQPDLDLAGVLTMDLSDDAAVVAAMAELRGSSGAGAGIDGLDLVINSAGADARAFGADEQHRGPFDVDAAALNGLLAVNVTGPMVLTREALPLLRQGSNPMIVNISSQLGSMQVAATMGRDTAYCVSKAALNMLSIKSTEALKPEGIGVVMIHPGWVQTDMGGPNAALTSAESAAAVLGTIDGLTIADTGRFLTWDGRDHPW